MYTSHIHKIVNGSIKNSITTDEFERKKAKNFSLKNLNTIGLRRQTGKNGLSLD